jgi:hypothetical protein
MKETNTIRDSDDNITKSFLEFKELFADFLHDFIDDKKLKPLLQQVQPNDLTRLTERFLPLDSPGKDSDCVYMVRLRGYSTPLYIITLVEHQTKVDPNMAFRILEYYVLCLKNYEKTLTKDDDIKPHQKNFLYPPVLPIVLYTGTDEWTAATNFLHRTAANDIFGEYIPSFKYIVVNMSKYTIEDITKYKDMLSLAMIILMAKSYKDIEDFSKLSTDYLDTMEGMDIPYEIRKLYARAAEIQARRARLPREVADKVSALVIEGGYKSMFEELEQDAIRLHRELNTYRSQADTYRQKAEMADTYRSRADTYRSQARRSEREAAAYKRELDAYRDKFGSL